jgi:hypothetical protein
VHAAVDTLGHLLALHVTAANEQDRAQVEKFAQEVQRITGDHVELARTASRQRRGRSVHSDSSQDAPAVCPRRPDPGIHTGKLWRFRQSALEKWIERQTGTKASA